LSFCPVKSGTGDVDTKILEVMIEFVVLVGDVKESLGGNTSDIKAGTSQGSSLFDADSVESQLRSFDGSDVSLMTRVVPPGPAPMTARS